MQPGPICRARSRACSRRRIACRAWHGLVGGAFGATCQVGARLVRYAYGKRRSRVRAGRSHAGLRQGRPRLDPRWRRNGDQQHRGDDCRARQTTSSKRRFTQWGWTLGAGLEYALGSRWSLGFEYDYLHFGGHALATPSERTVRQPRCARYRRIHGAGRPIGQRQPGCSRGEARDQLCARRPRRSSGRARAQRAGRPSWLRRSVRVRGRDRRPLCLRLVAVSSRISATRV